MSRITRTKQFEEAKQFVDNQVGQLAYANIKQV
jgi:hypothetical protein